MTRCRVEIKVLRRHDPPDKDRLYGNNGSLSVTVGKRDGTSVQLVDIQTFPKRCPKIIYSSLSEASCRVILSLIMGTSRPSSVHWVLQTIWKSKNQLLAIRGRYTTRNRLVTYLVFSTSTRLATQDLLKFSCLDFIFYPNSYCLSHVLIVAQSMAGGESPRALTNEDPAVVLIELLRTYSKLNGPWFY